MTLAKPRPTSAGLLVCALGMVCGRGQTERGQTKCGIGEREWCPQGDFSKYSALDPMKDLDMTIRLEGMVTA